ncbi:uncharacterized protein LOC114943324 [Nylanderia fulva]|uniref:uncharacterized protein LOC114943324 n=1 Tax=Nylanderia fulva TaxID=613905 RepID=UPI0010FBB0D6|nr:uncharacterized protein LOC114943324 [Nylanderia fulva]
MHGECCLHSSRFFHICKNLIFDPMHDILCGIGPMVLKLVLIRYTLELKFFHINDFNNRIASFQYDFVEKKNKPSANFSKRILRVKGHTLNQKAMQIWCLLRVFPFLISDWVLTGEEHLQLILLLLRIMEIVFAPKVTVSLDFLETFKQLFPDVHMINKFHHLTHYPDCMLWSGPLQLYNCMRYEAKHNEIKLRAQNVHNFKNPPKTLIRIVQCSQSARWGKGNATIIPVEPLNGETVTVQNCQSRTYLHDLGYVDTDSIFTTNAIKINGVEFRLNLLVAKCVEQLLDTEEQIEIVGQLGKIILAANIDSENWTTIAERPSTSSNIALVTTATSNEEISIPKESFSRFTTVRKTLLHHPQGANVLAAAEDIFTESHRRSLIRIVTSELVKTHKDKYYPPEEAKVALAESIVTEFPKLRNPETTKRYIL